MSKRLTKHGNSLALIIDKPLLDILKINEKTALELSIDDGVLIVRPKRKKGDSKDRTLDKLAKKIMDRYEDVFKKLAKS